MFCEPGVFTVEESREILTAARAAGLGIKLHADELTAGGGAELAGELGATSADHLAAVSDGGIAALAPTDTVATLLPGTMLFLGKTRAGARPGGFVDAGRSGGTGDRLQSRHLADHQLPAHPHSGREPVASVAWLRS